MPAATAAAAPPDDPPGVLAGFQGLRVMPVSGLSVTPFQPNSGVVVLPSSTASASRSRATTGASSFHGPLGSTVFEPLKVGQPLVSSRSLIETGTPSSAPRGSPFIQRASDSFAAASASGAMKQNAFSTGLSLSMRCKAARVTSSGEARLARYRRSSSVADRVSRSDAMGSGEWCWNKLQLNVCVPTFHRRASACRRPSSIQRFSETSSPPRRCAGSGRTRTGRRNTSTSRPRWRGCRAGSASSRPRRRRKSRATARSSRSTWTSCASRPSASATRCWASCPSSPRCAATGWANTATGARPRRTSPTPRRCCSCAKRSS